MGERSSIVLHACCAICSGYPISYLKEAGYDVTVYFYNPNIYPEEEYQKRLNAQKALCSHFKCRLVIGEYEPEEFYRAVKGFENEPEKGLRCDKCFALRLEKTALFAKQNNIENFTTSMVISPHKNFEKISAAGQNTALKYGLNYLPINFRKNDGFLKTNNISKKLNLYRQNYCGCKFALNHISAL